MADVAAGSTPGERVLKDLFGPGADGRIPQGAPRAAPGSAGRERKVPSVPRRARTAKSDLVEIEILSPGAIREREGQKACLLTRL